MKTCLVVVVVVVVVIFIATFAYADYVSPAIDFFMHGRQYETFLRDYYRFDESKPLRIEYSYMKWLNSNSLSSEYADNLSMETTLPTYKSQRLSIDIPFNYSSVPIWSEGEKTNFGCYMKTINLSLVGRLMITNSFRSIIGLEYNIKGDSDAFGKADGRFISIPKLILSYELFKQLNIMAGARIDKYYYDTDVADYALELADRLYCQPMAMINWHPSDNFILLLGLPYSGASVGFGDLLKLEARGSVYKDFEIGLRSKPIARINLAVRFTNTPYSEIPVESFKITEVGQFLSGRITNTRKNISFETGVELNPGALASFSVQYFPGGDVKFKNVDQESIIDGKPGYALGARFTVDIEALLQLK
jgi:hypothetical protein